MRLPSFRRRDRLALCALLTTLGVASSTHAYHHGDERIVDQTAHTLRPGETRLGLLKLDLGASSFLTVGTDTAAWATSFLVGAPIENGHVKLRVLHTRAVTVALEGAFYRMDLGTSSRWVHGNGALTLIPVTAFASSDLSRSFALHLGVTYAHLDVAGDGSVALGDAALRAGLVRSSVVLEAMGELRLNRVVALTLQLYGQPCASAPALRVHATDRFGDVEFVGTVKPVEHGVVAAIAGIALSGKLLNLRIGVGYGAIFLPALGIALPLSTVLPELDAYVRF